LKRATLAIALALCGVAMLSSLRERQRNAERELSGALDGAQRHVDFGIVLRTVRINDHGRVLLAGGPPLEVLREHRFGGVFDTLQRCWIGPTEAPVIWYVSLEQEEAVIHGEDLPEGVWFQGSMGAGKTTSGGIWLATRVIKHATRPLRGAGVTAPTDKRMEEIRKTLFGPKDRFGKRNGGMWPASWFTWREGDQTVVMATGLQIDFRSGHVQSSAAGSQFQGQNWAFALNDELQDYYEQDGDISMRGRTAPGGRFERFVTVTAKDDPGYRTFRARIERSPDWKVFHVAGPNSPFVHPIYWQKRLAGMTKREADRKVWGKDVGPEKQVYHTFARKENVRPLPRLGFRDVTAELLAPYGRGRRCSVLVGHDPGSIQNVSIVLKALQQHGSARHTWWVVDEITSPQSTVEQHVVDVLKRLRAEWGVNLLNWKGEINPEADTALVRIDPFGRSGDTRPHKGVTQTFLNYGLEARQAAYKPGTSDPGVIMKEARIDMVCNLFCNALGDRRLFIACDEHGKPSAERLVEAIERSERDAAGDAETQKKDRDDLSHWPSALGYALWLMERPKLEPMKTETIA
jgi:hypothetical protein